jgi:hypothetical protein
MLIINKPHPIYSFALDIQKASVIKTEDGVLRMLLGLPGDNPKFITQLSVT